MVSLRTVFVSILLIVHIFLGLSTISFMSPTYDEPVHITAGYSYWKTADYRLNAFDHPPFAEMWAAFPLVFMKPNLPLQHPYWSNIWNYQYPFSDLFLYHNRIDAEKMLNAGRAMILILSVILGLLMYSWANELFGFESALIALFIWAFSPWFIANGTLVTTDMALALFYFLSIYLLWRWTKLYIEKKTGLIAGTILLGISLGFLFASKYSSVAILPVIFMILLYHYFAKEIRIPSIIIHSIIIVIAILAVLLFIYQFNSLEIYYWEGLKKVITGVAKGRSSFLLGKHSTTGWWYYFPVVFLLKTPIPFIFLLIVAFFRRRLMTKRLVFYLLWPAAFYFFISCVSKVQIGHRHILPIYPFLTVWISGLFAFDKKMIDRAIFIGLLVLFAFSSIKNHPWHISYFNEIIGSPDNGYNYLTDSNVDWGQGLKELSKYLRKQDVDSIYMSYFGTGDPHYYGIKYYPIGFIDNLSDSDIYLHRKGDEIDFSKIKRKHFAISATNLQATYYADKKIFSFLNNISPEKIVARSILVYNMSASPK